MKGINRLAIIPILLLFSCTPKSLPIAEWKKWMENEENGLRQTKNEMGVSYILQYKNMDYILAQKGNAVLGTSEDMDQITSDAEKSLLFDLFITCDSGKASPLTFRIADANETNSRYYYYHFQFVNDIYIEAGDKKIKPLYCIADKGSGLNNAMAFSIGFERKELNEDLDNFRLVINDTRLGTGIVKFLFKFKNIEHIPHIKPES